MASTSAVTSIKGNENCSGGLLVVITAHANSGQIQFFTGGKLRQTTGSHSYYKTGASSATWEVRGANLGYASSYCQSGGFGGGGGNFALPPNTLKN